jgi:hypothetical protein
MAVFYIKTKAGDVFELTATTDVGFQHRNTNTKFPVESGASITDHSVVENSTFTLSGVITEVVNLTKNSPQKGIKDYIQGLDKLRRSRELFTVFLDNRLSPYKHCLFTEFSGQKGVVEGLGSWRINISIEQIRIVDKAKASLVQVAGESSDDTVNADKAKADTLAGKSDNGSKSSTKTRDDSLFRSAADGLGDTDAARNKLIGVLGGATPPDAISGAG